MTSLGGGAAIHTRPEGSSVPAFDQRRLRRWPLLALALATLCSHWTAAATGRNSPEGGPSSDVLYVDLTPDFGRIFDRDASLPDQQRVDRFVAEFASLIPGFYSAQRVYDGDETKYSQRVLRAFSKYPDQRAGIARVSDQFGQLLGSATIAFGKEFGGFRSTVPVYLVNSLGELDGGTRDLPSGKFLIFGADVIAGIHSNDRLMPLFIHEFFHVYHARQTDLFECDQVWCSLWTEGLAVYVSQRLNPDATDSELLLAFPEPIRAAIEAHRDEAICATLEKLDSRDRKDIGAMFSSARLGPDLPPRFGYYVGYLVARELGHNQSLETLAKLSGPALRARIGKTLSQLAPCRLGAGATQ